MLVNSASFDMKLDALRNTRNLAGTRKSVDEDLLLGSRKIRRGLIHTLRIS
jgi:hypothetical protein